MAKYQSIIGRAEPVDFVGTSLAVPAKIDTGAFRSSVHATDIKVVKTKDGGTVLRFSMFGHKCAPVKRPIETGRYDTIAVRSSNGALENRYEVTLKIKLGAKIFNTSFTLADRSSNVFPVLIGRKALSKRFMVDSTQTSVSRISLSRQFGISISDSEEDLEV